MYNIKKHGMNVRLPRFLQHLGKIVGVNSIPCRKIGSLLRQMTYVEPFVLRWRK